MAQREPEPEPELQNQIYKLTFYVPPSHTQACLDALFAVGAGTWPNPNPSNEASASLTGTTGAADSVGPSRPKYINTAFISSGTGQFVATEGARPYITSTTSSTGTSTSTCSGTGPSAPGGNTGPSTSGGMSTDTSPSNTNKVEYVQEDRVEMVIAGSSETGSGSGSGSAVQKAVEALRRAHPYEVPAFFVTRSEFY
ncbi:hypothetical protein HRR83_009133 [Exophiala dermatitidis]|uniref:ATP phosphoribosyltransferase n=2 Tax=Exophiala dermatitidis TaxID=5970 RepID=H6CAK6_EXODN|nr:uncharacterized protein HMPREF1120_08141 [Exophiala dermatitidis NIH/UT8656]XP_009160632.1 hypothetical protein, variant [Exophiala dermatitidis NIH/UT8656]KAJ4502837.1 hypothetical protein HRR75_008302 [Exophiala dermatitidis]EHY60170.1 hypothetical protein, variant [Exophiala dermatitidis NIH/UT8656]EHY60171.1 hypothetical protein HMPREF1120_08141 [Exophiala dermatitidis NIH/UT8656]KAJ4504390.1 hypothetical protein HRR74_009036 [Exophiala dermatitidis]KAJ4504840.1 hypothetical protein HR